MLTGTVDHGDSLGNRGSLGAGDVQWMTAGSGILHQEMPQGDPEGKMHGFQLWANLPHSLKMTTPRYQDIAAGDVPEVTDDDGTKVRIICGSFWGKRGPVEGVAADPRYLDVWVPPGKRKTLPVETDRHGFAYVFDGSGKFRDGSGPRPVLTEGANTDVPVPAVDEHRQSLARPVRSWRRGDDSGRRPRHAVSARVGQADRGTGGLARPDRDEHRRRTPRSVPRAARGTFIKER